MRRVNNSVETVNAASVAIANAERRVQQVTSQRRRWGGCLSAYFCFGDPRSIGRIGHASFSPERTFPRSAYVTWAPEIAASSSARVLPFIAPPSSPNSTLLSEPPSATHTAESILSPTAPSAETCSSGAAASMFTIWPFAHETQPVSPPVFSAFTTEPSTASLTPPEPVHNTTPSSPEVPLSQLLLSSLDSNLRKGYERRSPYQHYSGSPASNPVPSSCGCSGTSNPFPDFESHSSLSVTSDNLTRQKSILNSMQVDDQTHMVNPVQDSRNSSHNSDPILNLSVSFKLAAKKVSRPAKDKLEFEARVLPDLSDDATESVLHSTDDSQKVSSVTGQPMLFTTKAEEVAQPAKDEQVLETRAAPDLREDAFKKTEVSIEHSHNGNAVGDQMEMLVSGAEKVALSMKEEQKDIKTAALDSCPRTTELIKDFTDDCHDHPELVVRVSTELEVIDVSKIKKEKLHVIEPTVLESRPDLEESSIIISRQQAEEPLHGLSENAGLSQDRCSVKDVTFDNDDGSRLLPDVGPE